MVATVEVTLVAVAGLAVAEAEKRFQKELQSKQQLCE